MNKSKKQRVFIIVTLLLSLVAFFFLFKNFFLDIIKFQINNDTDGMNAFIKDKGLLAPLLIVSMEAIQMMCVFISVEFIQTATAMSYPWYISILICELGVALGATIIYMLVLLFDFDSSIFKNNSNKIKKINKDNKQLMMYLLFITPIVPFGFICYYGAKQKLGFRKYLFTTLTGVLPDIFVITCLGNIIKYVISEGIPIWILILIVVAFMAVLLFVCSLIMKKANIKTSKGTPNFFVYSILFFIFKIITKNKPIINKDKLIENDGPCVLLSNHPSFYDVYYTCKTIDPERATFILNRFYFRNKLLRFILKSIGVIPKKIFSADTETIKKTLKTIKDGYSIYMCPEGRLSVNGTNYLINNETAKLVKHLKVPVVIINIQGAYLAKPKWRKKQIKGQVETTIKRVISKEELQVLSVDELTDIINENLSFNDFEYAKDNNLIYKYKHKAEGLENILYYCPKCHKEHCLFTNGNIIKCNECGFELKINDSYWFDENEYGINNILDWYKIICEYEKDNIEKGIDLKCDVIVKKFNLSDKSQDEVGNGICYLDNDKFVYEGNLKVKRFEHSMKTINGLAFSSGEEFECYYENELYYFYPVGEKSLCCKWALIVDELTKVGEGIAK